MIPSNAGVKAVVQVAEGDEGKVWLVDAAQRGDQVTFDIPVSPAVVGHFEGRISGGSFRGQISFPSGTTGQVFLSRATSYRER